MKKRFLPENQKINAQQDFDKIKKMINAVILSSADSTLQLYPDYHIGQILCAEHLISIEIADMSSTGNGIWIQVRDEQSIEIYPSSLHKQPSPVYINTLIQLLSSYKQEDILKPQLQLRPFGIHYEY